MIAIIDYGAGNLRSVQNALVCLGLPCRIAARPEAVAGAAGVVLPGVGAFGAAAASLQASGLLELLRDWLQSGRPFLGICLGMQLLFADSAESPGAAGLGVWPGVVRRLQAAKVPHTGWSPVEWRGEPDLFAGLAAGEPFYFVHGFVAAPADPGLGVAWCDHGGRFPAVLRRGAAWGVQFHPEKSGSAGLRVLRNWGATCH
jgi:imidazole glycerol phosphate synthase glutamine amidotransferase subunit